MRLHILDTNGIIRFLVGDNKKHQEQVEQWFKDAEKGVIDIIIYPVVIAEVAFVFESYYKFSRNRIADTMEVFLSQRWLNIPERAALLDLWQAYRKGFHFVDSYLFALAQNTSASILTFDKKLKKHSH